MRLLHVPEKTKCAVCNGTGQQWYYGTETRIRTRGKRDHPYQHWTGLRKPCLACEATGQWYPPDEIRRAVTIVGQLQCLLMLCGVGDVMVDDKPSTKTA